MQKTKIFGRIGRWLHPEEKAKYNGDDASIQLDSFFETATKKEKLAAIALALFRHEDGPDSKRDARVKARIANAPDQAIDEAIERLRKIINEPQ